MVGDGWEVDVYNDKWLCNKEGFSVCSGYEHKADDVKVHDIIVWYDAKNEESRWVSFLE